MAALNICPTCGTELAPNAPAGLCAKCVFAEMLGPEPGLGEDGPEAAEIARPKTRFSLPRWFGGHELLEEIARGAMGVVYRARQARLKRVVALKVILAGELASPEFVRRFRTEAEAAAGLDHPNIVPIYEIGEDSGQPFFSMKLVEGHTLARRISSFKSPEGNCAAAALVAKLARAVHYAHQHGILHRDLKPNNVLLDVENEPHLTDFGLAKLINEGSTITKTRAVLGTPSYMAPEQARGETRHLTTAADVYSLGAILYELLTGQPPFVAATSLETIRLVMDRPPRRPTAVNALISRDLETICLKCLEKEPLHRYGSAEALAEDLERWQRGEPILARPSSTLERLVKWARRKPVIAILVGGLIVSVSIGLGTASWQSLARQRALVQSRRSLYAAQLGLVQQAWAEGHVSRAHALLDSLKPAPGAEDLRGFEWRYLWGLCRDQSFFTKVDEQNPVQSVAASPDGRWLALAGGREYVSLWDVVGRRVIARLPCATGMRSVAFSADSSQLAAGGYDTRIRVWDATTHRELFCLLGHSHTVERVAYSPDGAFLVSASRPDGIVKLWDLAARREIASFGVVPNDRPAAAFSPKGTLLAWSAGDHTIHLTDYRERRSVAVLSGHAGLVVYLAFSPDGRWLASAGADGVAKLWEVASCREVATFSGHKAWVTSVDFSPDGQLLVTTCIDGTIKLWDVATKAEIATYKGHEMWVNNAVFLPNGRTLASGGDDRNMKLWEVIRRAQTEGMEVPAGSDMPVSPLTVAEVGEAKNPPLLRDDAGEVRFTPDGLQLMAVDDRPVVQVWDGSARRLAATYALPDVVAYTTAFFPDGKKMATGGRDGPVRLWTVAPPALAGILAGADGTVTTLAISSDGRELAGSGITGKLWLWDVASRRLRQTVPLGAGRISAMSFLPGNRRLLASLRHPQLDDRFCLLDLTKGTLRMFPRYHREWVTAIILSPDEKIVATSSRDATVCFWQPSTLALLGTLRGHSGYVTSLAFSPDGLTVATASNDGTIKLWSVRSLLELITLPGHIAPGTRLAFSPDGTELAACGEDGVLRIWRAPTFADVR